ncbi:MAG: membrane protein insertion efficiency factor YidD [Candidatus Portnoybacteria bacterium]|nr:membrane protein insertion efficiency factor YidD [Candidatus Portnoybacteria bacterium]
MKFSAFWRGLVFWPAKPFMILIKFYQIFLSPESGIFRNRRQTCRFWPSCSHYSYLAFEKFGIFKGFWLSFKRIIRCHPFNHGGLDPLP